MFIFPVRANQSMLTDIQQLKYTCFQQIKEQWLASENCFPNFLAEVSVETKYKNQQYAEEISEYFKREMKKYPRLLFKKKRWAKKILHKLNDVLLHEAVIGVHNAMEGETIDTWQEELKEFLRLIRKLYPKLSFEEMGQAIRNYIVYAMIKEISGVKSGFSMAGFGYSMLYPVTDNYIDSTLCSLQEKTEYNQFIRDKIEGKKVHPKNTHQQKTADLLDAIESEFKREQNPEIFALLLLMLDAQEISLRQQNEEVKLSALRRLDISIYKGGISVLIDRFLVRKKVTEDEILFYLGLGLFLQLADDLQDIKEDGEKGYQTVFTIRSDTEYMEKTVNQLLHFIHQVMGNFQTSNKHFKEFILSNCYHLIYLSVIISKSYFSEEYLIRLEKYMLISAPYFEVFMENQPEKMGKQEQEQYMNMLDTILFLI